MYNKKDVFKEKIEKKANDLNELCRTFGIPAFMTFALYDNPRTKKTEYKNYISGSASNRIKLTDDQLARHINVANGFNTTPPNDNIDIDSYMNEVD